MNCGIYQITNTINGKKYIGQSKNLKKRLINHKSLLLHNKHPNKHLQNSVEKYGIENFNFSIITYCKKNQLNSFEQWFICHSGTCNEKYGYNKTIGGDFNPMSDEKIRLKSRKNQIKKNVRIIKNGQHHNKQSYVIRYNGKNLVHSCNKQVLEKIINKFFKNEKLKEEYKISDIKKEIKKITIKKMSDRKGEKKKGWTKEAKRKSSKKKNTTGYLYVGIMKDKKTKQGFRYRYRYRENKKTTAITAANLEVLEKRVKEKNLPWEKI